MSADHRDPRRFEKARAIVDAFERDYSVSRDRKASGVFYTPPSLVDAMLERLPLGGTIVDPSCGAGAFVIGLVHRAGPEILHRLHAFDIDPAALDACARALGELVGESSMPLVSEWRRQRAHAADFLSHTVALSPVDLVVGNPPYGISNDASLRERFPELRGEIDLFACFMLRSLERLSADGLSSLLVPDSWLTNQRAASLRRALTGRGSLHRIVDFGKPFASARDTRVHAVTIGRHTERCTVESLRDGRIETLAPMTHDSLASCVEEGWFLQRTSAEARAIGLLESNAQPLSDRFEVIYGLRTGDNARHIAAGQGPVPLIGGLDIDAYDRSVKHRHLMDPPSFQRRLDKQLGRRRIGIQRIRTNSGCSWRRWIEAALLEPHEVGLDSLTLVAARPSVAGEDELLALLGLLNSSIFNRWYRLTFTDVNIKPTYLARVPVPRRLGAELTRAVRHRLARPGDLTAERVIDRLVADAYGLDADSLDVLEQGYWGPELLNRPLPSRAGRESSGDGSAAKAGTG